MRSTPTPVYELRERALDSDEWGAPSPLAVLVDDGTGSPVEHLSWTREDGVETSIAFTPDLSGFTGHRTRVDGSVVHVGGTAGGPPVEAVPSEYTTDRGTLRLLVGEALPRTVTWRDRAGVTTSIALRSASPSGSTDITDRVVAVRADHENVEGGEGAANLVLPTHLKWLAPHDYAVLEFDLAEPMTVTSYVLTSADDAPDRDPRSWTVRGSTDGTLWRQLDVQEHQPCFELRHQSRVFPIADHGPFRHLRVDLAHTNGSPYLQLADVRFRSTAGGFTGHRGNEPHHGTIVLPEPQSPPMFSWTEMPQLLRTSFGDDAAWAEIVAELRECTLEYSDEAYDVAEPVENRAYEDLTKDELLALVGAEFPHSFLLVADKATFSDPEHPLLLIDLDDYVGEDEEDEGETHYGNELRATPEGAYSVVVNLDIANMDFDDFTGTSEDGVFRGF